jgi:S-ribosylhomocysteine lyase
MERIKSFSIDHDNHPAGFYLSGKSNGIYTYDLRFKFPNKGDYLTNEALHTVEHIFATVIRNSAVKDKVVYFGPMGCRTGFYLLLRDMEIDEARAITLSSMEACLEIEDIPGSKRQECGNFLEHNLEDAKEEIRQYIEVLKKL